MRMICETYEGGLLTARNIYEYDPSGPPPEAVSAPVNAGASTVVRGPWPSVEGLEALKDKLP